MDEPLQKSHDVAAPFNDVDDLYESTKAYWLFGDWQRLIELAPEQYDSHPEKAKISLLIGSAHLQLHNITQAEHHIKRAYLWQIDHKVAARILISGANNILGRIASLNQDAVAAQAYFEKSLDVGINNADLVAHSRAVKEMASLGLLPQAVKTVSDKLLQYEIQPSKTSNHQETVKTLKAEVELLNHEISLSQQKLQFYRNSNELPLEQLAVGSAQYMERLRQLSTSQLGQDLWVLEKNDFKKNGFFVEFGATDGVLLSNTYLLEKQFSWKGICAEPNPKFFAELKTNRACMVSDACIAGVSGKTVEFICADEYGGIAEYATQDSHTEKRRAYQNIGGTLKLTTISLDDLLTKHNSPMDIDYMSIDTEGSEYEILKTFDFKKWNIKLISVEHNFTENRALICNLLKSWGYQKIEQQFDDWYFKI